MKFNEFGKSGMRVSEIGFGGSRIGGVFAGNDGRREALNVLGKALDAGINFYDTADMYSQGESESLIGVAFRGRRDKVILATKSGYVLPGRRKLVSRIKPLLRPIVRALGLKRARLPSRMSGALSQDFSPPYLTNALEGSLKRLKTDFVDLYQLHSPGAQFMQSGAFGDALDTLERLKTQGKLRFYGVAIEETEEAPFCLSAPGISSVQLGFGLLEPQALNQGMLDLAQARGLGIIARGCFGGGLLKDSLDEAHLKSATPKWSQIVALRSLSERVGRPVLDIALQFCRGTPGVSTTLLGMHKESHLIGNLQYLQQPLLTAEIYTSICQLGDLKQHVAG